MKEHVLRVSVSDIRLSVILFDDVFRTKREENSKLSLEGLKSVHQHSNYEIFFVTGGRLSVMAGQETLDCENALVVIPPMFRHYTVCSNFEGYALNFVLERLPNASQKLYDETVKAFSKGPVLLPLNADERFYVDHIANVFSGEQSSEDLDLLIQLLFRELFLRILPQLPTQALPMSKHAGYINAIESYIARHYSEQIRLSDVATELYLCTKQITRIVRKEYGCSFPELVTRHRLSAACMLLRHTALTVRQIASNVGYHDHENYFFSLFKKCYGITPLQYREQFAREEEK